MPVNRTNRKNFLPFFLFALSALAAAPAWSFGPALPPLNSAHDFTALSKAGISNSGVTTIVKGNLGISPAAGTTLTGFTCANFAGYSFYTVSVTAPPSVPLCTTLDKTFVDNAVLDMGTAYNLTRGTVVPAAVTELGSGSIGGLTLAPGLYKWSTGLSIATDVFLNGGPTDTWIMQVSGDITVANGVKIHLTGGALPTNIYWQTDFQCVIGTTVTFEGIILAGSAITVNTGSAVNGNMYAQTSITMASNAMTRADIAVAQYSPTPSPTASNTSIPTLTPTPSPVVSATNSPTPSPVVSATNSPTSSPVVSATNSPTLTAVVTATSTPTPGPAVPAVGKTYLYPSPTRGDFATLIYDMAGPGQAKIRIYNEVGDLVDSLQEIKPAGLQSSRINLLAMAPGVYHYILDRTYDSGSSEKQAVKKFVILK